MRVSRSNSRMCRRCSRIRAQPPPISTTASMSPAALTQNRGSCAIRRRSLTRSLDPPAAGATAGSSGRGLWRSLITNSNLVGWTVHGLGFMPRPSPIGRDSVRETVHRDGMISTGQGPGPIHAAASQSSCSAAAGPGQPWSFQCARSRRPSTRSSGRRSTRRTSKGHGAVS
jgi:hypothetical protein